MLIVEICHLHWSLLEYKLNDKLTLPSVDSQVGVLASHVPSSWQIIVADPTRLYPSLQLNITRAPGNCSVSMSGCGPSVP